jgi:hypothetical protein
VVVCEIGSRIYCSSRNIFSIWSRCCEIQAGNGGVFNKSDDQLALLAADSTPKHDMVFIKEILRILISGKSANALAVIDTCNAGAGIGSFISEMPSESGHSLQCMAASGSAEMALISPELRGSIFTRSLIDTLAAAPKNSPLLVNDIFQRTMATTTKRSNGQQIPVLFANGTHSLSLIYLTGYEPGS